MASRHADWMEQAERDLAHADLARQGGHHEWACFAAEQAAEKAGKALVMSLGGDPWGHSVLKLLQSLPGEVTADPALLDRGRRLDRLYVASRDPDGFDAGKPADYFTEADATTAIEDAKTILQFCRGHLR